MYINIHIYTYMYIYIFIHIYICIHMYIHIHTSQSSSSSRVGAKKGMNLDILSKKILCKSPVLLLYFSTLFIFPLFLALNIGEPDLEMMMMMMMMFT
jgi:hypothetical protein